MAKRKFSLGYLLLGIFITLVIIKLLSGSLFLHAPERIQLVIQGQNTRLYSINPDDDVNYYIEYDPDLKVEIPSGYGTYRIGALSKLIQYEKKPDLLSKSFSLATSSFVTYYFYPNTNEIYYANDTEHSYKAPSFREIMLYRSNARFLDRIYLYLQVLQASPASFQNLDLKLLTKKVQNSTYLSSEAFGNEYKGFFYNKAYRTERMTVQIRYTENYDTAVAIGKILEGNGIRVVDISQEKHELKNCLIVIREKKNSTTVSDMKRIFGCEVRQGNVDTSDILFILGPLEREWEL